jgi:hypothetical protein
MQFMVEKRVEGLGEFTPDFAVLADVEPLEDRLVELASDGRSRGFVGDLEVSGDVEGVF